MQLGLNPKGWGGIQGDGQNELVISNNIDKGRDM